MTEPPESNEAGAKTPAVERVLRFILAEMDLGVIAPGSRVNSARIAAQLGLSVAPVREALRELAGRGVVDLLPDRGAVMRSITAEEVSQMWQLITPVAAVGLELAASAIAAGANTDELVAAFECVVGASPRDVAPVAFLLRLNDWHWAANRLGANQFVTQTLERIGVAYWDRFLVRYIDVHANIEGYLNNYRRMHEAVIAGDGPAAAAVLHFHANWSVSLIRQSYVGPKRRRRRSPQRDRD